MDKNSAGGYKYSADIKRVISLAMGNKTTNNQFQKIYFSHYSDQLIKLFLTVVGQEMQLVTYSETENTLSKDLRRAFANTQKEFKTICINLPMDSDMAPVLGWFQEPPPWLYHGVTLVLVSIQSHDGFCQQDWVMGL